MSEERTCEKCDGQGTSDDAPVGYTCPCVTGDWYVLSYPDRSWNGVRTRDEAVRVANSDGSVFGMSAVITGPFTDAEILTERDGECLGYLGP